MDGASGGTGGGGLGDGAGDEQPTVEVELAMPVGLEEGGEEEAGGGSGGMLAHAGGFNGLAEAHQRVFGPVVEVVGGGTGAGVGGGIGAAAACGDDGDDAGSGAPPERDPTTAAWEVTLRQRFAPS